MPNSQIKTIFPLIWYVRMYLPVELAHINILYSQRQSATETASLDKLPHQLLYALLTHLYI